MECSCSNEWLTQGFAQILSQVLKNQERSLKMRRRRSRSEVEVSFKCLEWPAEPRGEWGPIYSPHTFITVRCVRPSDISDLDHICPMGNLKWLNFGSDISDGAQIYQVEEGDTVLEPDEA
jgi:hypothetical protein